MSNSIYDDFFLPNKYTRWYSNIISNASQLNRHKYNGEYFEKHHILPKSFGGKNSITNLVLLTAREHFIVHLLLPKMCSLPINKSKMVYAFFRFKNKGKNSHLFERYKNKYAILTSGENNPFYGKTHSPEVREQIFGENHPMFGKKHSPESIKKMKKIQTSIKTCGKDNPMFGINKTKEEKEKQSKLIKGRKRMTKGNQVKMVLPNQIQEYKNDGWILTSRKNRKFQIIFKGQTLIYKKLKQFCNDYNVNHIILNHHFCIGTLPYDDVESIETLQS